MGRLRLNIIVHDRVLVRDARIYLSGFFTLPHFIRHPVPSVPPLLHPPPLPYAVVNALPVTTVLVVRSRASRFPETVLLGFLPFKLVFSHGFPSSS